MLLFSEKESKLYECQFRIRMGFIMENFGYSEKRTRKSAVEHCRVPRLPGSEVNYRRSLMD